MKMAISPKAIYKFNAVAIIILSQFFTETEIKILQPHFIWEHKARTAKTILDNVSAGGVTISYCITELLS